MNIKITKAGMNKFIEFAESISLCLFKKTNIAQLTQESSMLQIISDHGNIINFNITSDLYKKYTLLLAPSIGKNSYTASFNLQTQFEFDLAVVILNFKIPNANSYFRKNTNNGYTCLYDSSDSFTNFNNLIYTNSVDFGRISAVSDGKLLYCYSNYTYSDLITGESYYIASQYDPCPTFSYKNNFYRLGNDKNSIDRIDYTLIDRSIRTTATPEPLPSFLPKTITYFDTTRQLTKVVMANNRLRAMYGNYLGRIIDMNTYKSINVDFTKSDELVDIKEIHKNFIVFKTVSSGNAYYNPMGVAGYAYLDAPVTLEPGDHYIGIQFE